MWPAFINKRNKIFICNYASFIYKIKRKLNIAYFVNTVTAATFLNAVNLHFCDLLGANDFP